MLRRLGFESCMCHLCDILIRYYFHNNMFDHDEYNIILDL